MMVYMTGFYTKRRYVMAELRLKGGVLWFDKVCD